MRLTVETGPMAGTVVSLNREAPAILGSGVDCALRVQEAGVQPEHAVVKALKGEGFGLKALGPGVRVNGEQIEATPLNDGDVIELGTTRIAFGEVQKKGLPTISGYRIQEELGRGGMGVVYRAEQVSLHRQVALKVLSHELTEDGKFVTNFVAEAQAAAKLQHPNVVSVFDVEHDGDTYFYSMELMQSGSCEDWLKQNGAMPVDRALQVIADAAAGLAYAESLGIVHRDIKPDNLMLDQHGVVKIADLGLAGADPESEERAIGTPHFMAPEQVLRKTIDHRSDIYALGCTFYRLITGRTPFRGQTVKDILRAQVKDDAELAHKINNKVPSEVSHIIQLMMEKEPADRFQTANDLLEEVEILLRPPAKKGLWIGLAAVAVIAGGGAIYWGATKRGEQTVVEKYRDNPEMYELAKKNEALEKAARENRATIALLTARVSGLTDEPLAKALDQVATGHAGTPAAGEAKSRATRLRESLQQRAAQEATRQRAVEDHLAKLQKDIAPQLLAHDYALAMRTLAADAPSDIGQDGAFKERLETLQGQVITAAEARLDELADAVDKAATAQNATQLEASLTTLADNLAARLRWPTAVHSRLDLLGKQVESGRQVLTNLRQEKREGLWERYGALFAQDGTLRQAIASSDYAAAAAAADKFAATVPAAEPGLRAAGIGAAVRRAAEFQSRLLAAAAAGKLRRRFSDGSELATARIDLAAEQVVFADPKRRPSRERVVPLAELPIEGWFALADQVVATGEATADDRECFLAFDLLRRHATSADRYLAGLDRSNDDSGTGKGGYSVASDACELLLRRLPAANAAWAAALRQELLAGQRLAAGLRALSERRNIAAAGHLEKLLTDHEHSYLVLVLP